MEKPNKPEKKKRSRVRRALNAIIHDELDKICPKGMPVIST